MYNGVMWTIRLAGASIEGSYSFPVNTVVFGISELRNDERADILTACKYYMC